MGFRDCSPDAEPKIARLMVQKSDTEASFQASCALDCLLLAFWDFNFLGDICMVFIVSNMLGFFRLHTMEYWDEVSQLSCYRHLGGLLQSMGLPIALLHGPVPSEVSSP